MVFHPPAYLPTLPFDPPDTVSIPDFVLDDKYGRVPLAQSRPFFTCGLSGQSYSIDETLDRVTNLTRGLAKELGWKPNSGSEWDRVLGIFAVNTIDTCTLSWAVHKLDGVVTPANAQYSAFELEHQLRDSGAKCVFTALPMLQTTIDVCKKLNIPKNRIYLFDLPKEFIGDAKAPAGFKTLGQLIEEGKSAPPVESPKWTQGQGARQTAFLCYSSGTSGLPKGVMISHRNVIANTMQIGVFDGAHRASIKKPSDKYNPTQNALGLLPFSHIYALVVICHASLYQGDNVVVLPKFEMKTFLEAIQNHKINALYLVPPIIIAMIKNKQVLDKFDLSAVTQVFSGAAPLGHETADIMQKQYPSWIIRQGYGLTETCTVVSSSSGLDIWRGSCGSLIPGVIAKLVSPEGVEITGYDQPGELWAKSPSVVQGYLNNEKANQETFIDGYMRTGDEAVFRKGPNGHEHLFITDRIKELIKVKGLQVAPAELEAHLLDHEAVADCAVIPVPDDAAGEVPKAYVVKSAKAGGLEDSDKIIAREIQKHVEKDKARHKWLKGGVEFIDEIPKSPSGKILRRLLRDREKAKRQKAGAKL